MGKDDLHALANAFHAAAEQMRQPPTRHPMLAHLPEQTPDPAQEISRSIGADVLKAIGDVYLGQAIQDV